MKKDSRLRHLLAYVFVIATIINCSDLGTPIEDSEKSDQENKTLDTNQESLDAVGHIPENSAVKALETGKTFETLSLRDVFKTGIEPQLIYRSSRFEEVLCEITESTQFIILQSHESYLKIRLDRIAGANFSCPVSQQSYGYVRNLAPIFNEGQELSLDKETTIYQISTDLPGCSLAAGNKIMISAKGEESYQISISAGESCFASDEGVLLLKRTDLNYSQMQATSGKAEFSPKTLTFDLKIYATSEKLEPHLCKIAKGNPVLINENETTVQIPTSRLCDESRSLGYYRFIPGMWLDTLESP